MAEGKQISDSMEKCGIKVYKSQTDFLLVKSLYEGFVKGLSEENIKVRSLDKMAGLWEHPKKRI